MITIWDYSRVIKALRILDFSSIQIEELLKPARELVGHEPSNMVLVDLAYKERLSVATYGKYSSEPKSLFGYKTFLER